MILCIRRFLPVLVCALGLLPALPCGKAAAAEDLFTVADVHVDASGASSTEAMNAAIAQGRPKAFQVLFRRLTRQQDWARQPVLDHAALLRLSRGFTVAHERRSTTRYVADVTYVFNPDAVSRLLRASSIAYAQSSARKVLVIPMSPGVAHGPWSQALANPALQDGVVPFVVANAEEEAGLSGLDFDAATWNDVAAVAVREQAAQAALVQAVYADGHMTVNIRRLAPNEAPAKTQVEVPLQQTMGTTYPAAADAAVRAMEDLWKSRNVLDYSQRGRLTADMRIVSLPQWAQVQIDLAGVTNVTGVTVVAMDMAYARLSIAYIGNVEQLRDALGGAGVTLTNRGGQWLLSAAGR
jgi:hypothetical protein